MPKVGKIANLDFERECRKGIPEIVLGEGKKAEHLVKIAKKFYSDKGRVIITRVSKKQAKALEKEIPIKYYPISKVAVAKKKSFKIKKRGKVGIITAGTADIAVAEEAKVIAEEMGCEVIKEYDIGVAGIHRLTPALKKMKNIKTIIVVAGMEGTLPSIVAGLVDVLVIGVPTSVGYGYGGRGKSALMTMLQSCSPGLVVLNIDNGCGAGIAAAIVASKK